MTSSTSRILLAIVSFWSVMHARVLAAQTCYYPNGDVATDDSPCQDPELAEVGICCPLNWQCMSNGLCYLENEDYYERHTCTDRDWPSDSCPRICTHNMQAPGNEAILWCNHEDWCCDGNRSWNCCTRADTDYFNLPNPHSTAFISVTPTAVATPASSHTTTSPTSTDDSSSTTSTTQSPADTSTLSATSTTSSSSTSSESSASKATPSNGKNEHNNDDNSTFGLTVGLAVGIPILIGICGILAFYLFRRYRKPKEANTFTRAQTPPMEANYQNISPGTHAPELQGFPVAAKRTKSGRYSELYGSDAGVRSPALSTGSNGTSPPQYSPSGQQSPSEHYKPEPPQSPGYGGAMARIPEEPQELWGGYVPYRPPKTEAADGTVEAGEGRSES